MQWLACAAAQMPEASCLDLPGVRTLTLPRLPDSNVYNTVVYRDADALAAVLDEVAEAFREAGVRRWSVLAMPGDDEAVELLRGRGHSCAGRPEGMVIDLDSLPALERALSVELDPTGVVSATVQSRAYGWPPAAFAPLLGHESPGMTTYVAREEGEPACTLQIVDAGEDAGLFAMATDPRFQRRGLARALVLHALYEARERGLRTSSLQATAAGRGVYAAIGYQAVGAVELWEAPPPSPPPPRGLIRRLAAAPRARFGRTSR